MSPSNELICLYCGPRPVPHNVISATNRHFDATLPLKLLHRVHFFAACESGCYNAFEASIWSH